MASEPISVKAYILLVATVVGVSALAGFALTRPEPKPIIPAMPKSKLDISIDGDAAPLTVTIAGPQNILDRINRCRVSLGWHGPGGNGLGVDWGDGSKVFSDLPMDASCVDVQRVHTYSAPGTYRIKVTEWHPGPTDAGVTDWVGEATVIVSSKPPIDGVDHRDETAP